MRVEDLLKLQAPLAEPSAHDEMLFIVIHQVYELWFKQVLHELRDSVTSFDNDQVLLVNRRLTRVNEILRLLVQQVDILETMTPVEFNRFRHRLNPASGFQSQQFRELEWMGGLAPNPQTLPNAEWKASVDKMQEQTTLRDAFLSYLERQKYFREPTSENLLAAIQRIYTEGNIDSPLRSCCELLIHFDEQVQLWRFRHVQMVERMIGAKPGTGGSMGVPYLRATLAKRFFPELWEARTFL